MISCVRSRPEISSVAPQGAGLEASIRRSWIQLRSNAAGVATKGRIARRGVILGRIGSDWLDMLAAPRKRGTTQRRDPEMGVGLARRCGRSSRTGERRASRICPSIRRAQGHSFAHSPVWYAYGIWSAVFAPFPLQVSAQGGVSRSRAALVRRRPHLSLAPRTAAPARHAVPA